MASASDAEVSSEEESLSVVKRKANENMQLYDKKSKYCDNSNEETFMPKVLVRVEVEEMDESEVALDYSMSDDPLASTSKLKKQTRKYPCMRCDAVFESTTELQQHSLKYLSGGDKKITGQGTNCSVFGGNHKVVDSLLVEKETEEILPVSTELPETGVRESTIKKNRAMEDLEMVRKYLITNHTSYEMLLSFHGG